MADSLATALRHHQQGRLNEAELIYRQVLDENPQHADALHLLGVIAHQRNQYKRAIELMDRAIKLRPFVATYHANLAEAYRASGQIPEAVAHGQKALELQPDSAETRNNFGLALLSQNRHEEAITHFREALRLKPDFALAFSNLAKALREQDKADDAIAALRDALRLQPDLPHAHCNLGQMLLEKGDTDDALKHCQEAVRLKPDFAEALSNLGNVLREQGKLDEAKDAYARAINFQPRLAMAHNNMAQALQEEGKFDEANHWYQQALNLEPRSPRIHANLASLYNSRGQEDEAISRYRLALQMDPRYGEAHNGLGHVLMERGETAAALACFKEAVKHRPTMAQAHCNLGQALEELGEIEQAVGCFREALRLEPDHVGAHGSLATIQRDKISNEDFQTLQRLLGKDKISETGQAALRFGLAHVLDARGDHATAGEHIRQANTLRLGAWVKQNHGYSPVEHARHIDQLIENFTPALYERVRDLGSDSQMPIFIVGMPRSGTTLTEQILASHSKVTGAGELPYAREGFDSVPGVLGVFAPPAACMNQLTAEGIRKLAQQHLAKLETHNAEQRPHVADKMPDNYSQLGYLAAVFPKAKFIHCRRDVRDIALSCWITNFKSIRWACDLEHIATRLQQYQRLMEHWRKVLPVNVLEVNYEDTVSDLEGVARKLLDHCGLEWHEACLEPHKTKRPIRTASVVQVRKPVYTTSVARWKPYEKDLAPLLRALGM